MELARVLGSAVGQVSLGYADRGIKGPNFSYPDFPVRP